jgi:drug/metabolite transporter (DMT)-like permease
MKGNIITLWAVLSWSVYLAFGKLVLPKYDPIQSTSLVMILGAVMYAPIGLWHLPDFDWTVISSQAWIGFVYITFFASALAYLLLTLALKGLDSSQASVFMNAQPIVAALFSWLVYGEQLTLNLVIGGLITITGIMMLQKARPLRA